MDKHPYGEKVLNWNAPPRGATGLTIRQWYEREELHADPNWFTKMVFGERKQHYFIFRCISGSYDYISKYTGRRCGGYVAKMGYWHYDNEEERDAMYKKLIGE